MRAAWILQFFEGGCISSIARETVFLKDLLRSTQVFTPSRSTFVCKLSKLVMPRYRLQRIYWLAHSWGWKLTAEWDRFLLTKAAMRWIENCSYSQHWELRSLFFSDFSPSGWLWFGSHIAPKFSFLGLKRFIEARNSSWKFKLGNSSWKFKLTIPRVPRNGTEELEGMQTAESGLISPL